MSRRLGHVILIMLVAMMSACSHESAILGKWEQVGGRERIEFLENGTVLIQSGPLASPQMATYSWLDESRLSIQYGGLGALAGPVVLGVKVGGGDLTLTDARGSLARYRRAR